jgi:hypothetical protein
MNSPLVDGVLAGTIDNVRDIIAVVASATSDPSQAWDRTAHGVHILLMQIDSALAEAFRPTAGPSDEADPSLDPACLPVPLALLPADVARLEAVARSWGVLPATLAQTLVTDGLADIARRKQGGGDERIT